MSICIFIETKFKKNLHVATDSDNDNVGRAYRMIELSAVPIGNYKSNAILIICINSGLNCE